MAYNTADFNTAAGVYLMRYNYQTADWTALTYVGGQTMYQETLAEGSYQYALWLWYGNNGPVVRTSIGAGETAGIGVTGISRVAILQGKR